MKQCLISFNSRLCSSGTEPAAGAFGRATGGGPATSGGIIVAAPFVNQDIARVRLFGGLHQRFHELLFLAAERSA